MNISELRNEAQKLAHQAREILTGKEVSAEQTQEASRMLDDSDAFEARAVALEKIEARDAAYAASAKPAPVATVEVENRSVDNAVSAFNGYIRGDLEAREARAQGVGSDGAGGFLVPEGFVATLIKGLKAYGPLNEGGPVNYLVTASGNALPMPTMDDTNNKGALIAEGTEVDESALTFGQKSLGAYKYTTGVVKVSSELLQDAAIDPQAVVVDAMSERLGRILNEHFTKGTGISQPSGIVTGASAGVAAASATAISYEDLVNVLHSIDPAYRGNAGFMFNDAIFKAIRLLKDAEGRPIWQDGLVNGAPETILGRPFYVNNDMAGTMAAGNVTMLVGDFKKFTVRRVKSFALRRLDERFATSDQVGFVGFGRYDSIVTDARAIKKLQH